MIADYQFLLQRAINLLSHSFKPIHYNIFSYDFMKTVT